MFDLQYLENELANAARWLLADKDQRRLLDEYRIQKMKFERLRQEFLRQYADFKEHVHVISPGNTQSYSLDLREGRWIYTPQRDAVIRRDPGHEWSEAEARHLARIVGQFLFIFRRWLKKNRDLVHNPAWEWGQLTRGLPNTWIEPTYWVQFAVGNSEWAEPPRR